MNPSRDVKTLKGVGRDLAKKLEEMNILTVADVLEHVPFRYDDFVTGSLTEAIHEDKVKFTGQVQSEPLVRYYGKGKNRLTFRLLVEERYSVTVTMFNRAFYKDQLQLGAEVTVSGKWDLHRMTISATELQFGAIEGELTPVYSLRGDMRMKTFRRVVDLAFKETETLGERIPDSIRKTYRLQDRMTMLKALHFPTNRKELTAARRSYVYEECLYFQLKLQALRLGRRKGQGAALPLHEADIANFIQSLPFPLTGAQQRVTKEILDDIGRGERMNRLLQGDVGSGKTVIAAIALFATVRAGKQGALMVPTEILAEQHAASLAPLLEPFGIRVGLLTSSVKGKARVHLLEALVTGEIDVLVGTHALIQDTVQFKALHLVITDEQHRFGVEQRKRLRAKAEQADVLYMTATPIPRTLAISVFGDMDVSIIDEMPAGRKEIETYWAKPQQMERVFGFVEKELSQGRQAYVITPLIEESESLEVQNAIELHAILTERFEPYQVGLMHGRLTSSEKDDVMQAFKENAVQILVSTTVVEVGVNVPNASIIVIHDAERFGLAQLHQLRGRVGRGDAQSYCILIADPSSDTGKERIKTMTETNDGFKLAEKDLKLRGAGNFFGTEQSGLPRFVLTDPALDIQVMETARQDAVRLLRSDAFWQAPEYSILREFIERQGLLEGERIE
ncbi:ATP-dependent DNA helicase [Exiguobacterium sp. BMC-KP]|uniref:ATP-dependent DNA helicase RecG n=1 Tax=Exiguobacterium sp. BMC-KP TaxID=1684312 RepID=UPI0006AA2EFB|nr:ATP-dependent DNA helicase RecG [Exiguobacterium sp. BMC-KP]KOP29689.1 ATP-dependent DNA helicase [Exiguobacterium sp. BMC-KP]